MGGINSYGILDPDKIILNIQVKIPTIEDPTRSDIDTIDKTLKKESIQEQYEYKDICHSTPKFSKETTFGYDIYEVIFEKTRGDEATLNGFLNSH